MSAVANPIECRICRHPVDQRKVERLLLEDEGALAPNVTDRPFESRFVMCSRCTQAMRDGKLSHKEVAAYTYQVDPS